MLRNKRVRSALTLIIPAGALAAGLFAGPLRSAEWDWRSAFLSEIKELTALEPVRALPRTEAVIATLEAQRHLQAKRPYAAWEALRPHLALPGATGQSVSLLAARAAAEWGGWSHVREILGSQEGLTGEGLFLLARAEEELGNPANAAANYERYLEARSPDEAGVAYARLAGLRSRLGNHEAAADAFARAAAELPLIADWLQIAQVEQLVENGAPEATTVVTSMSGGSAAARRRRAQLEARSWIAAAETDRAISRLDWEGRVLSAEGARHEAAQLHLDRARLLLGSTEPNGGKELLVMLAADPLLTPALRSEAATALAGLSDGAAVEDFAIASAFEAGGRPGLAARHLRSALASPTLDSPDQRYRLARLLYEERDFGPARGAFQRAAELLTDREQKAQAELFAARSLFRTGGSSRAQQSAKANAIAEFRSITERFEGTAAAGTAFYLLGDEAATTQSALNLYRQAAAISSAPEAREALYRVGDRSLKLNDSAGALRAWESYVARYPRGDQTARVAYEVGKLHRSAGRSGAAQSMFRAAIAADPASYYALRAAESIGEKTLTGVIDDPAPWIGLASEPAEAADVLARLDLLVEVGLKDARDAEYQAALRAFEKKPVAKLVLAEGLNERDQTVEAIRLGRELLALRNNEWDPRLLRVVYPLPYRDIIEAEASKAGLDPMLFAGLIRQESTFRAAVKSPVGATGLGQIMPATGRWLAPTVGIRDYDNLLLEVPEVNLRMGSRYLADLLRRYNGAADLALAGYNAGPSRADRWRRELNHGRDTDAFRSAVPFDETRNYITIVLRNAAIYDQLYGRD
jgi:soluble lytic murein transglycosylase